MIGEMPCSGITWSAAEWLNAPVETIPSFTGWRYTVSRRIYPRRYSANLAHGCHRGLDFTGPSDVEENSPVVVVSHGLTGGKWVT
jgi:hypothetical protein